MDFLQRVQAVLILDDSGKRLFAKYYCGEDTPPSSKALASLDKQRLLEQSIYAAFRGMSRASNNWQDGNVLILDGHSVIFQLSEDIAFIVVGDCRDNELVLLTVLKTLVDSLREVLGTQMIGSREILEEYQALLLTVDELLDEGIVLETNSYSVAAEVSPYLADTGSEMTRKALSTVNKYLRENL